MSITIRFKDIVKMIEHFETKKEILCFYVYPFLWKELQLRPIEFKEFIYFLHSKGYKAVKLIQAIRPLDYFQESYSYKTMKDKRGKRFKGKRGKMKRIHPNLICRWVFKGEYCGYAGNEQWCDHTKKRCKKLGNYDPLKQRPNIFDMKEK